MFCLCNGYAYSTVHGHACTYSVMGAFSEVIKAVVTTQSQVEAQCYEIGEALAMEEVLKWAGSGDVYLE